MRAITNRVTVWLEGSIATYLKHFRRRMPTVTVTSVNVL